jgi:hypothetical protein
MKLQQISDPKVKSIGIRAIHKVLKQNFEEIVEKSESYGSHMKWADNFSLRSSQAETRPTSHEIFFYKSKETRKNVMKVIRERNSIREKNSADPEARSNNIRYAFPEEFNGKWLNRLGSLLGYPDCCVKYYSKSRENGINVEAQATQQLLDKLKEGEVDAHAYYIGNFIPHEPNCPKAIALGYAWEEKINDFNEELGQLYSQMLVNNVELILRQPELVSLYLSQFKIKVENHSGI